MRGTLLLGSWAGDMLHELTMAVVSNTIANPRARCATVGLPERQAVREGPAKENIPRSSKQNWRKTRAYTLFWQSKADRNNGKDNWSVLN